MITRSSGHTYTLVYCSSVLYGYVILQQTSALRRRVNLIQKIFYKICAAYRSAALCIKPSLLHCRLDLLNT